MTKPEVKKYNFKEDIAVQIELVSLSSLFKDHSSTITIPHRTNFYHIFWFKKCSPVHSIDFTSVKIKPDTLLFINKNSVHSFDKNSRYEGKVLVFTDDFFCTSENDAKFLQSTVLFNDLLDIPNISPGKSTVQLAAIFNLIAAELKNKSEINHHGILKSYLHNFLLLADREKRKLNFSEIKKGADFDYSFLFKGLLDKHFSRLKSVKGYAGKLNISEKRLNLATSKILGKSPKEMIDERVLLEAKRLLVHGSSTIKEIGFQLGFEEPTNFIKYFRKHTVTTPLEFREKYLIKTIPKSII